MAQINGACLSIRNRNIKRKETKVEKRNGIKENKIQRIAVVIQGDQETHKNSIRLANFSSFLFSARAPRAFTWYVSRGLSQKSRAELKCVFDVSPLYYTFSFFPLFSHSLYLSFPACI